MRTSPRSTACCLTTARRLLPPPNVLFPAIILTSRQADAARAAQAGFDEHLVKPASFEKLTAVLDAHLTARGGGSNPGMG